MIDPQKIKRKGLTTTEIIISAVVITVVILVMTWVFVSSDKLNERARRLDAAVFTSVSIFENLDRYISPETALAAFEKSGEAVLGSPSYTADTSDSGNIYYLAPKNSPGGAISFQPVAREKLKKGDIMVEYQIVAAQDHAEYKLNFYEKRSGKIIKIYSISRKIYYKDAKYINQGGGDE